MVLGTPSPYPFGTVAGTAHTQEYLLLHIAMFPIGAHFWYRVLGMPSASHEIAAFLPYNSSA